MEYKISVIIPVYNVELYIEECLQSIMGQTLSEGVECILVDDCGGDNSIEIASNLISQYKGNVDFSILHHEHNSGLSASRNTAIRNSRGKYLYFMDSDDYLFPDSLRLLWEKVCKYPDVDIVQGNLFSEDTGRLLYEKDKYPEFSNDLNWVRKGFCYLTIPESACNRLIKRDIITDNNLYFKEGWIQEDTFWSFQIHDCVYSISFCFEKSYFYRKNPNSIMHSSSNRVEAEAFARIFNEVYCLLKNRVKKEYHIRYLERICMRILKYPDADDLNVMANIRNSLFIKLVRIDLYETKHPHNYVLRGGCKVLELLLRHILCYSNNLYSL